jgi:hypothetical protein
MKRIDFYRFVNQHTTILPRWFGTSAAQHPKNNLSSTLTDIIYHYNTLQDTSYVVTSLSLGSYTFVSSQKRNLRSFSLLLISDSRGSATNMFSYNILYDTILIRLYYTTVDLNRIPFISWHKLRMIPVWLRPHKRRARRFYHRQF